MNNPFETLPSRWPQNTWLAELSRLAARRLRSHPHGDLPRWQAVLRQLPRLPQTADLDRAAPRLGAEAPDREQLRQLLMELHPWRKGPLVLGGERIETEWRSDWKWERVAPHVDLSGHRVLDIGCGNGYFGLRMLGAGAELVIGIDPTLLFVMQHLACRHFSGDLPNYVLPLGIEDLPDRPAGLDTVFSMGVLYHRRDPVHHLVRIRELLKKGGTMVLETLVLPKRRLGDLLVPQGRYARMRNVWAIPGTAQLLGWVEQAGLKDAEVVDITATTTSEQRRTHWMSFESLEQALDPLDSTLTIEGLPAPVRAILIART
ncbi:MAG: tRNA 5-methoxyuridine(34)/uridine 5-oxyacetic acid(34) synthase CmoB [Xanthomonadales bacterium]|jgi:tRNA (mo5U34)-methyltransferase|nr:tRNA 5-methoxyuridine(34)/uridine 5-oxyacetic acid(34) synthase CmoB [Xanthomonadales bacterium]